jgi:hypothetical protein
MDDEIEVSAVREMRERLGNWLAQKDWDVHQLEGWLQGNGLPALDDDEEPYVWLLRGLPLADERYSSEIELAARASRLLETQPDTQAPAPDRDELLYNLLMLCAGLSCPTQLADPLHAMFQRRQLTGVHQSINLRQALESALITNQRDDRLSDVWLEMIRQRGHEFLTGDEYAAFEGVRLMPASEATRGEPAMDAIGAALAAMSAHLEERRDRRLEFHRLINLVLRTYPQRPLSYSKLVYEAHDNGWPDWAVSCLPKLFIPLATQEEGWREVLLWEVFVAILESAGVDFEREEWLCHDSSMYPGLVTRVRLPEDAFHFLSDIAPKVESNRLTLGLNVYRDVIGAANDALSSIEIALIYEVVDGRGLFCSDHIRNARENLRRLGLGIMTETASA